MLCEVRIRKAESLSLLQALKKSGEDLLGREIFVDLAQERGNKTFTPRSDRGNFR